MNSPYLPWQIGISYFEDEFAIRDPSGECVAVAIEYSEDEPSLNADFIVRACNSHYKLVEALKMFIAAGYGNSTHFGIQEEAYNLARAALAKAKGEA